MKSFTRNILIIAAATFLYRSALSTGACTEGHCTSCTRIDASKVTCNNCKNALIAGTDGASYCDTTKDVPANCENTRLSSGSAICSSCKIGYGMKGTTCTEASDSSCESPSFAPDGTETCSICPNGKKPDGKGCTSDSAYDFSDCKYAGNGRSGAACFLCDKGYKVDSGKCTKYPDGQDEACSEDKQGSEHKCESCDSWNGWYEVDATLATGGARSVKTCKFGSQILGGFLSCLVLLLLGFKA